MLKLCIVATFFLFSADTFAQSTKNLTLKDAVGLAVRNSHLLRSDQAKVAGAAASVKQAEQDLLPSLGVSGSYLRINHPNISAPKNNNNSGNSNTLNISQAAYGILSASYPIYAGGKLKFGIESARYLEEATKLDAENDKESVILNTINAYTNLFKARAMVDLLTESLASSMYRDTTFSHLETNGLLARNELLKSTLQTSNIELSLLDAESNLKLAIINVDLMLGLPENTLLVPDSGSIRQNFELKNIEDYETAALQHRKDIQAIALRKKAASTNIKSARAESSPNIALTAGYIAAYVPNFITITNAINLGIGIQYNLASLWRTNTKLLQAKAMEEGLQSNEQQLNDAVRLQVNQEYQEYVSLQKKIEVYTKALYQATENYRITKNKYDNSLVTTTELLDADVAQLQSRLNLALVKIDAMTAYNKLLQAAGLLNY
ncbi:MAG: TolC family protein [Ginsengibacter sp.]